MSTENELKTPTEWCRLEGVEILDADGWRGRDGRPWTDPITLAEFRDRLITCTQRSVAPAPTKAEDGTETLILVSRRYASLAPTWNQHGADLDTVLRNMTNRAREGKADSNGYEVLEVTVRRRFHIKPVIATAEVTEVTE